MNPKEVQQKQDVLICTCSGACPSMANIDFWTLAEQIRLEIGDRLEYLALHHRLCEADGERLMGRLLSDDTQVVTPACAEKRQEKLLRDGFAAANVSMDSDHWIPVSMAQENTATVFEKVRKVIDQ